MFMFLDILEKEVVDHLMYKENTDDGVNMFVQDIVLMVVNGNHSIIFKMLLHLYKVSLQKRHQI